MAEGPSGAIGEALAELGGELERAAADAEQLAFLPMGSSLPEVGDRVRASVAAARRGRPPGAQNLATRQMKELCRRLFGDPLLEMMRWAQHTPESLALELGCSKAEAFDRLVKLLGELAPFFHARMVPTDEDGRPAPVFQMTIGTGSSASSAGAPPWKYLEENQGVAEPSRDVSHAIVSHGQAK